MPSYAQEGEIYFIRERSITGSEFTPFVKIGLVNFDEVRNSLKRLGEHQTGNPRQLVLPPENIVKTINVNKVEASLHKRFAEIKQRGEWFVIESEEKIEEFISQAKQLAAEMQGMAPVLEKVAALDQIPDNSETIEATRESKHYATQLCLADLQQTEYGRVKKNIDQKVREAIEYGFPLGNAKLTKTRRKRLDTERLKAERPDLVQEFSDVDIIGRFIYTKFKNSVSVNDADDYASFNDSLSEIQTQIDYIEEPRDAYLLLPLRNTVEKYKAHYEWERDKYKSRLKLACGENLSIKDVCTWKRYEEYTFHVEEFKEIHEDIAEKYMNVSEVNTLRVS